MAPVHVDVRIPVDADTTLAGLFREGTRALSVVLCHPLPAFGGNMRVPLLRALDLRLARAGYACLRFDFRGVGESTGRATGGLVEHADVAAAVRHLRARGPVAVCGYSFGALMAMRAAGDDTLGLTAAIAIGLPTVIAQDNPARVADLARGLAAAPWLLVTGDRDQFCDLPVLERWAAAAPETTLTVLPGIGHFYSETIEQTIGDHLVNYLDRLVA